jgi:hypothetical protein
MRPFALAYPLHPVLSIYLFFHFQGNQSVCSLGTFYYMLYLLVEHLRWWGLDDDQLHSSNDYFGNDYDYTELSFAPNWQPMDHLILHGNWRIFLCITYL